MPTFEVLKDFGLTDNEAKVYLAALELGQATVQDLAKKSMVKRTTVYTTFPMLKEKGLLSQIKKGKRTLYFAEKPENLLAFSARRHEQLKTILPELKSIHNRSAAKPKMSFYEGQNGYLTVYENILKDKPSELLVVSSYQDFLRHVDQQYEDRWMRRRVREKIKLRCLDFNSPVIQKARREDKKLDREIRLLPDSYSFTSALFIYQDKVVIISGKQKDFTAVLIENSEFYQMFKQLFEMLWRQAE